MNLFANLVIRATGQGYYVIKDANEKQYLHVDGKWRDTAANDEGVLTGLFVSKETALKCVDKFKPVTTLADVKDGEEFIVEETGEKYVKLGNEVGGKNKTYILKNKGGIPMIDCFGADSLKIEVEIIGPKDLFA